MKLFYLFLFLPFSSWSQVDVIHCYEGGKKVVLNFNDREVVFRAKKIDRKAKKIWEIIEAYNHEKKKMELFIKTDAGYYLYYIDSKGKEHLLTADDILYGSSPDGYFTKRQSNQLVYKTPNGKLYHRHSVNRVVMILSHQNEFNEGYVYDSDYE